jgi:hypothetical protein
VASELDEVPRVKPSPKLRNTICNTFANNRKASGATATITSPQAIFSVSLLTSTGPPPSFGHPAPSVCDVRSAAPRESVETVAIGLPELGLGEPVVATPTRLSGERQGLIEGEGDPVETGVEVIVEPGEGTIEPPLVPVAVTESVMEGSGVPSGVVEPVGVGVKVDVDVCEGFGVGVGVIVLNGVPIVPVAVTDDGEGPGVPSDGVAVWVAVDDAVAAGDWVVVDEAVAVGDSVGAGVTIDCCARSGSNALVRFVNANLSGRATAFGIPGAYCRR